MRSIWSVPLTIALAIAGVSIAQAQQAYPEQFANQWSNACVSSCQSNAMYKERQGLCTAYCTCILQEAQANVPLEVAMQADKDLAANNNQSDAVKRVNQVTNQCQSRFAPQQQQPKQQRQPARQSKSTQ